MKTIKNLCVALLPVLLALPLFSTAQTVEYDHRLFSFKIHDALQYEVLEGIPVYASSTIFLNIKEITDFDNAAKYADALENKFLDEEDVYTERGVDTLDGWPVIYLKRKDESKDPAFQQEFYLFDDGKTVFSLSISGYRMDERVIRQYFSVTKSSFTFKTQLKFKKGLSLTLPKFMTEDENMFWSHLYNKDQTIDIPIYVYHDAESKYEDAVKSQTKNFKSLKPTAFTEEQFTIGNAQATCYAATYVKKLKTTSEEESKCLYVIQHPQGGVVRLIFSGQPQVISIMGARMKQVMKSASF